MSNISLGAENKEQFVQNFEIVLGEKAETKDDVRLDVREV